VGAGKLWFATNFLAIFTLIYIYRSAEKNVVGQAFSAHTECYLADV
jgi:hypothetical protein